MLDGSKFRTDFPILDQVVYGGKRLAYLDSAATSQKPQVVIDAVRSYYEEINSNVHRALHYLSEQATLAYEGARAKTAAFIGAAEAEEIVFTRGTTEGINLVAQSWGRSELCEGDEILLTLMEHHSNLVPWQLLAGQTGAVIRYAAVHPNGELDREDFLEKLGPRTRLVAFTHSSNVLGTVNPVAELTAAAHEAGALVLVDGAQSVPHIPVDVQSLGVDFLAFSGHKMLAPTGIGVLYGRREHLERMPPYHGGGEMIQKVTLEGSTYAEPPHKFEAGTPHIEGVIGLSAAIDYLDEVGMEAIHDVEHALAGYLLETLKSVDGVRIFGEAPGRGGAVSFTLEGIHPHDLSQFVDREGVALRAGHMCCQPLIKHFGHNALNRASIYLYNVQEDIDQLAASLRKAQEFFTQRLA